MATLTNPCERAERGQAIVELALTLPLLLLVILGIFDFGLMFQRYEVVTNAAREGARLAVLPDYTAADAVAHAQAYLASGGITGPLAGACGGAVSAGQICVSAVPGTVVIPGQPPKTVDQMVVTVEYDHQHVFVGPIIQLFGGSLGITRLQAVSRMRVE